MSANGYAERLLVRVIFSAVVLFFSARIIAGYFGPEAAGGGRLEESGISAWTPGSQVITFSLQDYSLMPYVRVLVNDEVRGSFDSRYVTVAVQEGDVIALDGTFYDRPVAVEVMDVSGGVKNPLRGAVYRLDGNVARIGVRADAH